MTIAVTGANGFLGQHLIRTLKLNGYAIRPFVRKHPNHEHINANITDDVQIVDYSNIQSISKALSGCDILIHTLGLINGSQEALQEANEKVTERLMQAAISSGVRKIIHISSVAALMRHGPYGESKFLGEAFVVKSGIPYTIFRPAYIYGKGDRNNTALLVRSLKKWPLIPLLGGGSFKLQPVYVGDVVSLILKAIEFPAQNQAFNVAGSTQISLKEMLLILSQHLGVKRPLIPISLKPVQALMRVLLFFSPNTKLPAKQILELDKHEAFDILPTSKTFGFAPLPYAEGAKQMFQDTLCAE